MDDAQSRRRVAMLRERAVTMNDEIAKESTKKPTSAQLGRRELLRVFAIGAAAATTSACAPTADAEQAHAPPRTRYQAGSPEVQTFYRVNRYPGR
jgi:hypothetical protein